MTPTHEQVLAVIDKARHDHRLCIDGYHARVTHCDDLRATAERHAGHADEFGPCVDYQQVIDRLNAWGVL